MREDLRKLQSSIEGTPGALDFCLSLRGDFRQLFDPLSAEWHSSDIATKRSILKQFEEYGVSTDRLCEAFKVSYAHRPDIVQVALIGKRAIELGDVGAAFAEFEKKVHTD